MAGAERKRLFPLSLLRRVRPHVFFSMTQTAFGCEASCVLYYWHVHGMRTCAYQQTYAEWQENDPVDGCESDVYIILSDRAT